MSATVLLVGAGGIGSPCAMVLAEAHRRGEAPAFDLLVADEDVVDVSNLHRQVLFEEADVGADKLESLAGALRSISPALSVALHHGRLRPSVALDLVSRATVVVDATDNFASRFLAADAALLAGRPIIHAASVRWHATVLATSASGRPCYRCLFEDLPGGDAPDCSTAGVVGPVCGVAGALAAELALRLLRGGEDAFGFVFTFDGRRDRLRRVPYARRGDCELCGASPAIRGVAAQRYAAPTCE